MLRLLILLFVLSAFAKAETKCKILSRTEIPSFNSELSNLIENILEAHRKGDATFIHGLFHPRLAMPSSFSEATLLHQRKALQKPLDYSLHQLWWLEGADVDSVRCSDGMTLFPHYGYTDLGFLSLQIQGQKELGRIFITLVPQNHKDLKNFQIGYYHFRVMTFLGQNAINWGSKAAFAARNRHLLMGYYEWSLAESLARQNPHFTLPEWNILAENKPSLIAVEAALEIIQKITPDYKVLNVEPIFHGDAPAMKVRWQTKDLKSAADQQSLCKDFAKKLKGSGELENVGVLHCALNHVNEDVSRDGMMGSLALELNAL